MAADPETETNYSTDPAPQVPMANRPGFGWWSKHSFTAPVELRTSARRVSKNPRPTSCGRVHSRELRKLIRSLPMPEPFNVETFVELLAEQRGRPITLHPVVGLSSDGVCCGVWAVTPFADCIFFEADTTPLHRAQIIGHEIGHMLAGHQPRRGLDHLASLMMPDLDSSLVSSALLRFGYSDREEKEAELAGSMILQRALATYCWQPLPIGSDPQLVTQVRVLGGGR